MIATNVPPWRAPRGPDEDASELLEAPNEDAGELLASWGRDELRVPYPLRAPGRALGALSCNDMNLH
jgi:hypothetical protein